MAKRLPPLLDRMAALLDSLCTMKRGCRWVAWRNGHPAFCRRAGCDQTACTEPPRRHLSGCSYGAGLGPAGVGHPCSVKCQAIQDVLLERERQPVLFAESA